jgi:hypothetical protein
MYCIPITNTFKNYISNGLVNIKTSYCLLGFGGGGNDGFYGNNVGAGYDGFGPGGGMGGPPAGRFVVHMRGLPYRVTENDIAEVFIRHSSVLILSKNITQQSY